jgi:rare lipoprotein A
LQRRGSEAALLLLLAGCATGQPRAPIAREPALPQAAGPDKNAAAQARPVNPRAPKIGNPYQVFGIWYYPADDRGYDVRGVASWYGPGFHALNTANGETYDQDGISGAHKTLPLPSYVEVENLDNGRKLTVRLNDRGPFVDGRVVDLSRKAAQLLGVDRPGTAQVRVRRVFPDAATIASLEPQRRAPEPILVASAGAPPLPQPGATVSSGGALALPAVGTVNLPPGGAGGSAAPSAGPAAAPRPASGGAFVQVAALSDPGRVAWLSGYLAGYGPVVTERIASGLTRIRLGPYQNAGSADAVLARVRAAGYSDARLIAAPPVR